MKLSKQDFRTLLLGLAIVEHEIKKKDNTIKLTVADIDQAEQALIQIGVRL